MTVRILTGDCRHVLPTLDPGSVQCCTTSPPYFGLRNYGVDGQIGLESTVEAYVAEMVSVFREVRRVLRDDGVLWLNLGDSYAGGKTGRDDEGPADIARRAAAYGTGAPKALSKGANGVQRKPTDGLKPKDMIGIPWRVAFALQADGWWLRSDCIWAKPNPMPESVRDRPTKAHEYVFLLTKSERYFYDADAVKSPAKDVSVSRLNRADLREKEGWSEAFHGNPPERLRRTDKQRGHSRRHDGFNDRWDGMSRDEQMALGANLRTVWNIATRPFKEAHFATFPPDLAELCIKSGSRSGDTVLDPFGGAGTTGLVADRLGRDAVLIELNPDYADMARRRITGDAPLFSGVA